MSHLNEPRLNSYLRGFFPRDYFVEIAVLRESNGIAPRATISITPPIRGETKSHSAYLHEILDISYMVKVAMSMLAATDNSEARQA